MNIIIKTGFQNICHNITSQPQTEPKGKALAIAEHVRNVEEDRHNEISYLITATVIRQTNITSKPYAVQLHIDTKRLVTDVTCTCAYSESKKCKHIAAVIYYINNVESLTKTSFEQQWGKPTARQFAHEKYSKGCDFAVMFPPPKRPCVEPPALDISELKGPSALKNILLEAAKDETERDGRILRNFISNGVDASEKDNCQKVLQIIFKLCEKQDIYSVHLVVEKELKDFYDKFVVLSSRDEIIRLCCDTLNQSHCKKWFAARRLRISASKNVHNIKSRKTKTIESLVEDMLYPQKVDTPTIRYGKKHEKNARKQYELLYNVRVENLGLIVSEKQSWLCASPDGAIIKNCSIEKLVEFKCPFSCKKLPIIDYEAKKSNVHCVQIKQDNTVQLKESAIYYTQCQVQIYMTGTSSCDLFVWSPVKDGSCCVVVPRNQNFLLKVIPQCEQFYFKHYLPALYQKMILEPNKLSKLQVQKEETPKYL